MTGSDRKREQRRRSARSSNTREECSEATRPRAATTNAAMIQPVRCRSAPRVRDERDDERDRRQNVGDSLGLTSIGVTGDPAPAAPRRSRAKNRSAFTRPWRRPRTPRTPAMTMRARLVADREAQRRRAAARAGPARRSESPIDSRNRAPRHLEQPVGERRRLRRRPGKTRRTRRSRGCGLTISSSAPNPTAAT